MLFSQLLIEKGIALFENIVVMGLVRFIMNNLMFYIMDSAAQGLVLKGMVFTIEPMINAGRPQVKELNDGWTVITQDLSLSAQWDTWLL